MLRRPVGIELNAHAPISLARNRQDDINAVLGSTDEAAPRLGGGDLDPGILGATQRRAPGTVEIVAAGLVVTWIRLVDDAASRQRAENAQSEREVRQSQHVQGPTTSVSLMWREYCTSSRSRRRQPLRPPIRKAYRQSPNPGRPRAGSPDK